MNYCLIWNFLFFSLLRKRSWDTFISASFLGIYYYYYFHTIETVLHFSKTKLAKHTYACALMKTYVLRSGDSYSRESATNSISYLCPQWWDILSCYEGKFLLRCVKSEYCRVVVGMEWKVKRFFCEKERISRMLTSIDN